MSEMKRRCPLAGASMTQGAIDRYCAAKKEEAKLAKGCTIGFTIPCLTCTGQPPDLQVIDLEKYKQQLNAKQEETMGTNAERTQRTCELCGETKMCRPIFGKITCTMCENLRACVRIRPAVVVAALKDLAPESLPAGDNEAELEKLRARVDELTAKDAEQEALLERRLNELEEANMMLNQVKAERDEAKRLLDEYPPVKQLDAALGIAVDNRQALTDLALRLAIGSMRGEIL